MTDCSLCSSPALAEVPGARGKAIRTEGWATGSCPRVKDTGLRTEGTHATSALGN